MDLWPIIWAAAVYYATTYVLEYVMAELRARGIIPTPKTTSVRLPWIVTVEGVGPPTNGSPTIDFVRKTRVPCINEEITIGGEPRKVKRVIHHDEIEGADMSTMSIATIVLEPKKKAKADK